VAKEEDRVKVALEIFSSQLKLYLYLWAGFLL